MANTSNLDVSNKDVNDADKDDTNVLRNIGLEMLVRWNEMEEQCKSLRDEFIKDYLSIIGEDAIKEQKLIKEWNVKNNRIVLEKIAEMKQVLKCWMDINVAAWIQPVYDIVER